ncbi:MAG TPA: hypothetical protein VIG69_05120, partial [Candidatus Methylomirabilis sp.]
MNEIAEFPAGDLSPLPPIEGRTKQRKLPPKLLLVGGSRILSQEASDPLRDLSHRLHDSRFPARTVMM